MVHKQDSLVAINRQHELYTNNPQSSWLDGVQQVQLAAFSLTAQCGCGWLCDLCLQRGLLLFRMGRHITGAARRLAQVAAAQQLQHHRQGRSALATGTGE